MNFHLIDEFDEYDVDQLMGLYANEFWCSSRRKADVLRMLENTSLVLGIATDNGELVGFARVQTDYVYQATVYDVIAHPDWRGRKIGKMLMDAIINHEQLRNVEHIDLNCLPDMVPFYRRWNFTENVGELGFMRRFNER